jgi:hypothetical protein
MDHYLHLILLSYLCQWAGRRIAVWVERSMKETGALSAPISYKHSLVRARARYGRDRYPRPGRLGEPG